MLSYLKTCLDDVRDSVRVFSKRRRYKKLLATIRMHSTDANNTAMYLIVRDTLSFFMIEENANIVLNIRVLRSTAMTSSFTTLQSLLTTLKQVRQSTYTSYDDYASFLPSDTQVKTYTLFSWLDPIGNNQVLFESQIAQLVSVLSSILTHIDKLIRQNQRASSAQLLSSINFILADIARLLHRLLSISLGVTYENGYGNIIIARR
jgi:hypothetical protein